MRRFLTLVALACPLAADADAERLNCAPPPFDAPALEPLMQTAGAALAAFPLLARSLRELDLLCVADPLIGARGYYEAETNRIVIDASLPGGLALAVLVHEIRHQQQDAVGACPTVQLTRDAYAGAVAAMEADASVTGAVVAWHLREAGQPEMWNALAAWPMQADIVSRFAAAKEAGGTTAEAASAAFTQWHLNQERVAVYYQSSCLDYLDKVEDAHLVPGGTALPADYYDSLCVLPDGARYACAAPS